MTNRKPTLRLVGGGSVAGLKNTAAAAHSAFHQKPWLKFVLKGQLWIVNGEVATEDTDGAELRDVEIEHWFRVDPAKIKAETNNVIQAIRDRIAAVQRMVERVAIASGQIEGGKTQLTRDDLPDVQILTELYGELDEAMNRRVCDSITEWTYTGEQGEAVTLTPQLLAEDIRLAEAVQMAWGTWYSPTKPSSGGATTTKKANGTTGSTHETQTPPSSVSPTLSSVGESNGMIPLGSG